MTDALAFTAFVDALVGTLSLRVKQVFLIRVDNWFGPKWLGFVGKVEGALTVRRRSGANVVIPPFKPSRIVSERRFLRQDGGGFKEVPVVRSLHRNQTSVANLNRQLTDVASDALFMWFSGGTLANGRGSVLVAYPVDQKDAWYVGLKQASSRWSLAAHAGPAPRRLLKRALERRPPDNEDDDTASRLG